MRATAAAAAAGKPGSDATTPNPVRTEWRATARREAMMARLLAALVVVVSFLLVAPVIESGTPSHVHVFQAVGDACDSGGGGGW
jgi:hypothetical protein